MVWSKTQKTSAQPGGGSASPLLALRYWFSWLLLGLLRSCACLPVGGALFLGRMLGLVLSPLLRYRRRIAAINLRLCFPELSDVQRKRLLRQHMAALGTSVMEMALAWWAPDRRLTGLARIEGMEHLDRALHQGKGVLLVTGHFTAFEMGGRLLLNHVKLAVTYQEFRNPVLHRSMERARRHRAHRLIRRRDLRSLMHALRSHEVVWYAPDQDAGRQGVFAPFFSVAAATHTATSRIARASGAAVLPYTVHRLADPLRYRLTIHPPLADFPSADAVQDATRINALFESAIRLMPEQYLWVHRRFKTRPPGDPCPYPPKPRRTRGWFLRALPPEAFERFRQGSQVLSRDAYGDKVLRAPDGHIMKLFRIKRPLSSARFYSHARRFARNAARLQKLDIPTVQVHDVRRLANPPRHVVMYGELPGQSLAKALSTATSDEIRAALLGLAGFMALLHRKGIYFRSLHLGNVLVLPDTRLGLVDVSDLSIRRRALGPRARARNFRHLLRRAEDRAFMAHLSLQAFFGEYCRQAEYSPLERRLTAALLTRSWSGLASGHIDRHAPVA